MNGQIVIGGTFVFPTTTAPASRSRRTISASAVLSGPWAEVPHAVGVPDHSAPGDGSLIASEQALMSDLVARTKALKAEGKSADMKQRLMELYFRDGGDLTDIGVLVQAAADCGLDADDVRRRLASDEDVASISEMAATSEASSSETVSPLFKSTSSNAIPFSRSKLLAFRQLVQVGFR